MRRAWRLFFLFILILLIFCTESDMTVHCRIHFYWEMGKSFFHLFYFIEDMTFMFNHKKKENMATSIEISYKSPKSEKRKGVCSILVSHEGKSCLIPTGVKVYPHEWDTLLQSVATGSALPGRQSGLMKAKTLLEEEYRTMAAVVSQLSTGKSAYTLSEIITLRKRWRLQRSFFTLAEHRIDHLRGQGQHCTADNYCTALNSFRKFRRQKDIHPAELTGNTMGDFQKYLLKKGLSMNTVSLYNRNLRAIYNYALDEGLLAENRHPFRKVFTGVEKTRKRAVRGDVVKRLMALPLERDPNLDLARDLFLFSIYTQGMSFVDVAHLTVENLQEGQLVYSRRKTRQRLAMDLLPCARNILEKYAPPASGIPYLLPVLYNHRKGTMVKYSTARREYNRHLRLLSGMLELSRPLSSHCARHTWASLAKSNGIRDTVISEMMGHESLKTTAIYLASLDTETTGVANRTIITSLFV